MQHFGHIAELRGEFWINCIVWRQPRLVAHPWQDTPKARVIASRKVDDLAAPEDAEMHARLVERVLVRARKRWEQLQDPAQLAALLRWRDPGADTRPRRLRER